MALGSPQLSTLKAASRTPHTLCGGHPIPHSTCGHATIPHSGLSIRAPQSCLSAVVAALPGDAVLSLPVSHRLQLAQNSHVYTSWGNCRSSGLGVSLQGRRKRGGSALQAAPELPADMEQERKRIAVFVSGGGSNFKAVHAACLDGRIHGDVVAVVSDVPTCGGVQYAQQHGIPTLTFPAPKSRAFPGLTSDELLEALAQTHEADLVVLAGFLKLVPADVVRAFKQRILNIHPALLPSFGGKGYYGIRVHQAVVAAGVRLTGPTVHFVDEEYDKGPILAQTAVPVYPTDTPQQVAARVLKQEHIIYPMAVAAICDGRLTWRPDGVPIIWNSQ